MIYKTELVSWFYPWRQSWDCRAQKQLTRGIILVGGVCNCGVSPFLYQKARISTGGSSPYMTCSYSICLILVFVRTTSRNASEWRFTAVTSFFFLKVKWSNTFCFRLLKSWLQQPIAFGALMIVTAIMTSSFVRWSPQLVLQYPGTSRPRFCAGHKKKDMVRLNNRPCLFPGWERLQMG